MFCNPRLSNPSTLFRSRKIPTSPTPDKGVSSQKSPFSLGALGFVDSKHPFLGRRERGGFSAPKASFPDFATGDFDPCRGHMESHNPVAFTKMMGITNSVKTIQTTTLEAPGVECWINGHNRNHGNPGCKTQVPQCLGLNNPTFQNQF